MMNSHLLTLLSLLTAALLLVGCNIDLAEIPEQTDAAVYEIIDETWADDYGEKTNYRINPVTDPNVTIETELPQVLNLDQAVAIATTQNRVYATEKENLYLVALQQTDVEHLYEPLPFGGGSSTYRNGELVESFGTYAEAGFEQLLATGAQISTNISLGWLEILSGDMRSGFSSIVGAAITQPLLRGAGRKIVLENLTQAQRDTLYQIRSFNRFRKQFVTEIITDYYTLLELNDVRINTRDYYFALADMHQKLQKRAVAGKLPLHELEQANQDRLRAMSDYVEAQKEYDEALDAFKLRLAISPAEKIQINASELEVLRELVEEEVVLSQQQAVDVALEQRLDLANAADRVLDAERKVDVAADAIRTELNLVGSADVLSYDDFKKTQELYELSLQLDLPIDRLFEKNNYRRALITLLQQQRAHEEKIDTVVLEVQTSHRRMSEARQRYQIEEQGSRLAEKRTGNTLLLLQYNRANTRDTLDAREDYLDAKIAATEALVDYAIATLAFFRDTEIMKIKPDGNWEQQLSNVME
jgi:outer membrane protein TolC